MNCLECFDTVDWVTGGSQAHKNPFRNFFHLSPKGSLLEQVEQENRDSPGKCLLQWRWKVQVGQTFVSPCGSRAVSKCISVEVSK